jgi:hypothetical protein
VQHSDDPFEVLDRQDELQSRQTAGDVLLHKSAAVCRADGEGPADAELGRIVPWAGHFTARPSACAPATWHGRKSTDETALPDAPEEKQLDALSCRKARARLLAKVHELHVAARPR